MQSESHLELLLHPKGTKALAFAIPNDAGRNFPCFTTLMHLFRQEKIAVEIDNLRFRSDFDIQFFWEPLLVNGTLQSPLSFPPELLDSLAPTFELQACRMLIHWATLKDVQISISFTEPATAGLVQNLSVRSESTSLRTLHDQEIIASEVSVRTKNETSDVTINHYMEGLGLSANDQGFLAWLFEDDLHFEKNTTSSFARQLWTIKQDNQVETSASSTAIERLYTEAYAFKNDCIIEERQRLDTIKTTDERLFAELLVAYAHLKCSLQFDPKTLNRLIDQTASEGHKYWFAYLKTYGHWSRSFNRELCLKHEFNELTEAYKQFKYLYDLLGITRIYIAKASMLTKVNRHHSAKRLLRLCENIRKLFQDPFGIARVQNSLAYVTLQADEWDQALDWHVQAINHLKACNKFTELAFTYSQISWLHLLMQRYGLSVSFGQKALDLMETKNISTLSFRTKPDLHAQLGLSLFFDGQYDEALQQSDYCEAHKVDSSPTGEVVRTLLRALINEKRNESHLADLSFNYIPELLKENTQIDVHLELLYLRISVSRWIDQGQMWKANKVRKRALTLCAQKGLKQTILWFEERE